MDFTASESNEIMTIKLRYKNPAGGASKLISQPVNDDDAPLERTSDNFRFSAAVAEFGMLLRNSSYKQKGNFQQVITLARSAKGKDTDGYRDEFIKMVESTTSLSSK